MEIEELIDVLQKQINLNVILKLEGIIETNIIIENTKIKFTKNSLAFENIKNKAQKIKLNLNQLMRINKIRENEILLEFDQLQDVTIVIKNLNDL